MPKLTELKHLSILTPSIDRSQGIHLTDIMRALKWDKYREAFGEPTAEIRLIWECGFIWERVLSEGIYKPAGIIRPEPICLDKIWCSPDGIDRKGIFVPGGGLIEDKYTDRSEAKHEILEDWWFMTQAKSYCKVTGYNKTLFRILYASGDYSRKIGRRKIDRYYLIEFTDQEINDNWSLILNYAHNKGLI